MIPAAYQRLSVAQNNCDQRQEFLSLYPNRVQAILRPRGCKGWTTISKHWPLPDETILSAIGGHESSVYGLRWGEETRLAVLDIDEESKYHSAAELQKLQEKLAAVGLTVTPYRSSESGGWHLYLFFDGWSNSGEVQEMLRAWLTSQGYEIRGGTLELFPCGNGLRLPLQAGFAWLDEKGQVTQERKELQEEAAISRFLCDLERNKRNWSEAKTRIESQISSAGAGVQEHKERLDTAGFDKLFNYRLIPENYQKGREYWQTGLTAKGQRHDAILCVEHYLWHGDESAGVSALPGEWNDQPRYRLIMAWLEKKHNGFCNHINKGKWSKVEAQVRRSVTWRRSSGAPQVRTPYPMSERAIERLIALYKSTGRVWSMDDFKKGNDGREEEAREKIREAVQLLTEQGRRVTVRQLMRLTGCSYHTVKRHLDIWKISPVAALPRAAGDKNPCVGLIGVGGGAPVAAGSCPGPEKEFLDRPCLEDSGDLELGNQGKYAVTACVVQDNQTPDLVLKIGSPGSCVLRACFPVLNGRWRRRGKATGRRHRGSSASPPHTQPSTGSKHRLLGPAEALRHKRRPPQLRRACAGSPPFIPRADCSKGSGLVRLQEGGSSQGGRQISAPVLMLATGLFVIPQTYKSDSGGQRRTGEAYETFRYQVAGFCIRCLQACTGAFGTSVYSAVPNCAACIRVNSPAIKPLRILIYNDVRGPPAVNMAY